MNPFRFGVNVRTAASAADWIALARKLEDLGYSTLNLPDHLTELPAPFPALASAAAATTRLRVATLVLNNDFRHPVLLAREAATLDVLSGGRLQPGRPTRGTPQRFSRWPSQPPHPPILIGGNGPRLLTLAATEADIVGLSGITFRRGGTEPDFSGCRASAVDERVRLIEEAAAIRSEPPELNALVQRVLVTDD